MNEWYRSSHLLQCLKHLGQAIVLCFMSVLPSYATNLVIATVNNDHMIQLQKLSSEFERVNPDIKLKWVVLKEHELRQYVSTDILMQNGQFDVMTIGMYEVPLWAKRGWLKPITATEDFRLDDLITNIREGLSYQDKLYASPIYGESSMLMYRKDLMEDAGLTMPLHPTWTDVATLAAKLNDPKHGIYGICLRGKPGWGENMTLITPIVNAYGGQWFNMRWQPQLESKPWKDAVSLYVDVLKKYGPIDAVKRGFNENLALFLEGKCAIWVDATIAAGLVSDPNRNQWASDIGFAQAPQAVTTKGSHWLWAWALAIPSSVDDEHEAAAQKFIHWATSPDYIKLVAAKQGWGLVPTGTRKSTYANPNFQQASPWARYELDAIRSADPTNATLLPSPYLGVQFVAIPEFRYIGDEVGKLMGEVLSGRLSVDEALSRGQFITKRLMNMRGYQ